MLVSDAWEYFVFLEDAGWSRGRNTRNKDEVGLGG